MSDTYSIADITTRYCPATSDRNSAIFEGSGRLESLIAVIFSKTHTGWLATQWDSNQSPRVFPANREFAGKFAVSGLSAPIQALFRLAESITSSEIPYATEQGIFEHAGEF